MINKNHLPQKSDTFLRRVNVILILIGFAFFVFLLRLVYLQLIQGNKYFDYSENNRLYSKRILAPRGSILDRKGRPLVYSSLSFAVEIKPAYLREKYIKDILSFLNGNLNKNYDFKVKELVKRQYIIDNNLSMDEAVKILEKSDFPEALDIDFKFRRKYVDDQAVSHFAGYLGKIPRGQLDSYLSKNYDLDENVGIDGIENYYEDFLHGKSGVEKIVVDARRNFKEDYESVHSKSGYSIILTIDKDIQKFCYELMREQYETNKLKGVVLVMNPDDASILAMVSTPSYDPNIFVSEKTFDELEKIKEDKPYLNRAVNAIYPPGSIIKLLIAYLALENKLIRPDTEFYCGGQYFLKGWNQSFNCWIWNMYKYGHGSLNIVGALKNSCNVFFYHLSNYVDSEKLLEGMELFGLGEKSGIDLPVEGKGFIPRQKLLARAKKRGVDGDTLNLFIGQGNFAVTPIQIANMYCAFANGGRLYNPHLLKQIEDIDSKIIFKFEPSLKRTIPLSDSTKSIILEGLFKVVNERGGTAHGSNFNKSYRIAGKTGTAESPSGEPHAWFAGFAPMEKPEILVLILLENAGHGGDVSAPIAKKIFDFYYEIVMKQQTPEEPKIIASNQIIKNIHNR